MGEENGKSREKGEREVERGEPNSKQLCPMLSL